MQANWKSWVIVRSCKDKVITFKVNVRCDLLIPEASRVVRPQCGSTTLQIPRYRALRYRELHLYQSL